MAIENRSDAAEIRAAASILLERMNFLKQAGITFGGARDLYEILGYSRNLTTQDYRGRYARGGIAKRVVEALPNASWRGGAELVENESPKVTTAFEKTWETLEKRLHIWSTFRRADILAGLSTYSVVLIGAPGNLSDELPKGKPESLLYLTPFCGGGGPSIGGAQKSITVDADATIKNFIIDTQDERFGLPEFYQLRRVDIVTPELQVPVHWTRILHLAENVLDDEVYGQPTLEVIMNLLDDLDKVTGGGAEAFWLRANAGISLDVDKDMTLEPAEKQALKDQADEYQHQMRRMLRTRGVTVSQLGSDVANFANPADAIITQIAGAKGIPKRILVGSEMGTLASEQDRDNWSDQINGRRESYCGPNVVRPFVDRLIKYGYLPTPKDYDVVWPTINVLTEGEKAAGALSWAQTNSAAGVPVFTADEVRDHFYALDPLPKPKTDAQGNPISEDGQPLAPTHDPKTGLPIKVEPPPVLGKHPISGLPVEVDTKTGKPAAAKNKPFPRLKAAGYAFSSTQINLPWALASELRAFASSIDNDALHPDGIEMTSHITVKYGIHTSNAAMVAPLLESTGPITITLDTLDVFQSDEYDVLIVKVLSPDLVALNAKLSANLAVTDTHPTYQPHVTLAYLQPGQGARYVGDARFVGLTATFDTVLFSGADDVVTPIKTLAKGNWGHAGRIGKVGGSAPKIGEGVAVATGDFDFDSLGLRRFLFHPATGEMVFGSRFKEASVEAMSDNAARGIEGASHAEEFVVAQGKGAVGTYDQHLRGWVEAPNPAHPHGIINVFNDTSYGEYWPGGRDSRASAAQSATDAVVRRFVDAGASRDTLLNQNSRGVSQRAFGDLYPELFKQHARAAESEYDTELLHILEAAIIANNTEVISELLGLDDKSHYDPHERRDEGGQWTVGGPSNVANVSEALAGMPATSLLLTADGSTAWDTDLFTGMVQSGLLAAVSDEDKDDIALKLAREARRNASRTPMLVFGMAAASDWASTGWALHQGGEEANPTINWLKSPAAVIAAGAGLDAVGAWAWAKVVGPNHPKIQAAGFYIASAVRGAIVIHNVQANKPRHNAGFDPSEARNKAGKWTAGLSLKDDDTEDIGNRWRPSDSANKIWLQVAPDKGESAGVKFAKAFEHHHQINLAKPNFWSVIGAMTGFSDMGRAIGLEGAE